MPRLEGRLALCPQRLSNYDKETASMPAFFVCSPARRFGPLALCAALATLVLVSLWGCDRKKAAPEPPTPVEVTVIEAKPRTAPMAVDGIGHVFAIRTVNVRSQVTGVIKKSLFAEGDVVKEGQSLLVIDRSGHWPGWPLFPRRSP